MMMVTMENNDFYIIAYNWASSEAARLRLNWSEIDFHDLANLAVRDAEECYSMSFQDESHRVFYQNYALSQLTRIIECWKEDFKKLGLDHLGYIETCEIWT